MKVHFVGSRESLIDDIHSLQDISKRIKSLGHELVRDWIDQVRTELSRAGRVSDNWRQIVEENVQGIAKADVIVAESSFDSFAVGYLVSVAIQQKKPILLLRHRGADQDSFVTGVESGWIVQEEYDDKNITDILKKFFDANDIQTKDMRFNFFIDRPIYNYLRWASLRTGKTKAEILRDLVAREIDKETKPSA